MIKKDNTSKQIRIYCLVVGIISFFIVSVCGQLLNRNTVNEEKMRAAFTAETTVNRIKSQLKDIYPLKGNEAAFGIDMLNNPARKHEANLAMKSGQYTIAGPYELNQGGLG